MKRISYVLLCCCLLPTSIALACGTYFGPRLTADRDATLLTLWEGGFDAEAPYVLAPPPGLPNLNSEPNRTWPTRSDLELSLLGEEKAQIADKLAYEANLEDLRNLGAALPEAAVAYHAGVHRWLRYNYEESVEQFRPASTMPGGIDMPWPLMAEFMIGRSHKRRMGQLHSGREYILDQEESEQDSERLAQIERELESLRDLAVAAFERTRQRIAGGEPDPLGLGVGSLGAEARVWLDSDRYDLAIIRYAQQAALGDDRALISLRFVLPWVLTSRSRTEQVLADADSRAVLTLYMYSHFQQQLLAHSERAWPGNRRFRLEADPDFGWAEALQLLIDVIEDEASANGADPNLARLAALMYRQGRYDLAERFANSNDAPMAAWVRAKLALRVGDMEAASQAYGQAIRGFPESMDLGPSAGRERGEGKLACRVRAEAGVLALSRGEFIESMAMFLQAGGVYWHDAAYVAERILTLDELIGLVEAIEAGTLPIRLPERPERERVYYPNTEYWFYFDKGRYWLVDDVAGGLRDLLARRLMRAGRYDEAMSYFQHDVVRDHARRYRDALDSAERLEGVDKALQLFEAATIARSYGLRILSFDSWPDWAVHGANLSQPRWPPLAGSNGVGADGRLPWLGSVELERVLAHSSPEEPRFSYRLVAAELADQAADQLDPKSQEFAAMLCHATRWLLSREPQLARRYYRRYLNEGAPMPWAENFGRNCPAPLGFQGAS